MYAIVAPTGGFGNHLRWLLLLDPKFSFNFGSVASDTEKSYNNLKGNEWPVFENFYSAVETMSDDILREISNHFDLPTLVKKSKECADLKKIVTNPTDKINLIKEYVYGSDRSWQNWLMIESKFKKHFDDLIFLTFNDDFSQDLATEHLNVITAQIDPKISLKTYIKFNSLLNHLTIEEYFNYIHKSNLAGINYSHAHDNVLNIDTGLLFDEVLDKDLYNQVTSWFKLDNYYNEAAELHKIWFLLHKTAEVEMIRDLQDIFKGE